MKDRSIRNLLEIRRRRQIMQVFRQHAKRYALPVWLSFSGLDYLYSPEHWLSWLGLRVIFAVLILISPTLIARKIVPRKFLGLYAVVLAVVVGNLINIMVAMSGGATSAYIPGVILTTVTGISLFKLNGKMAIATSLLTYGPCIGIIALSGDASWQIRLVEAALLIAMSTLSAIFRETDQISDSIWATTRVDMDKELRMMRRTEFLKRHFPAQIRKRIESGNLDMRQKRVVTSAVVGFADISSSTAIANQIDLQTDWYIKEAFLNMATSRATECGLVVLTHTGDGFLFLANYFGDEEWPYNLISFYEGLQLDFDSLKQSLKARIGDIETGIKCAVAMGPALVGFIGDDQAYFTVMGPSVNLAARLCSKAAPNEIVMGYRVWDVLKNVMLGWATREVLYEDLKGFDHSVRAVHILPRTMNNNKNLCPTCAAPLTVVRTPEGFIDVMCPTCRTDSLAAQLMQGMQSNGRTSFQRAS
jgi:class 3 adenylate cyclase